MNHLAKKIDEILESQKHFLELMAAQMLPDLKRIKNSYSRMVLWQVAQTILIVFVLAIAVGIGVTT